MATLSSNVALMCVINIVGFAISRVRYATVLKTDYPLLVRVERGVRWILEQYRSDRAQALVTKARLAAARLLAPPEHTPPSADGRQPAARAGQRISSDDALTRVSAGVAQRDLNLVDSLLAKLEDMEANEGDPDSLARLYQLDHLAARLRRNAENLRVLSGRDAGHRAGVASPLVDVIRAAMSSIEQYHRIEIERVAALAVMDLAADDLSRLLAELLDNAAAHSPPVSKVTVSAKVTEQGSVLMCIEDTGTGLPADQLRELNSQLSAETVHHAEHRSAEHLGLAVVRRLAARHGIRVSLHTRATHGTTTTVLVPVGLLCEAPATPWFADTPAMKVPRPAAAQTGVPANRPSSHRTEPGAAIPALRTTRNGLPRRIPKSLREFGAFPSTVPSPRDDPDAALSEGDADQRREQLMTDLDDFSEGEQAAREVPGGESPAGERRKTT